MPRPPIHLYCCSEYFLAARPAELGGSVLRTCASRGRGQAVHRDIAPETQGTFLGDYRVRQQQAACREWPTRTLPKNYRLPVTAAVPTLFVSCEADGGTPVWYADRVAAGFSNHLQVVVKGQGHTEWSDCLAQLYQHMVRSGS